MKTKLIAWYLPQYHCIPENDVFWGKGFTDWVTVKKAFPLFKGHIQPRKPLNDNYYDLSQKENIQWQSQIAKEYGIYGFGIYHYWFNNDKNILTKPAEIILDNKDIDINYFFAWDNASWVRSWSSVSGNAWAPISDTKKNNEKEKGVLIQYILGEECDWMNHYKKLLTHFKDKRYIKIDNKPVFVILQYSKDIAKMCHYWDSLAQNDGFDGIFYIFKNKKWEQFDACFYRFNYEPHHHGWMYPTIWEKRQQKLYDFFHLKKSLPSKYSFDKIWSQIIHDTETLPTNIIPGAFIDYDDTPRRGKQGKLITGSTPEKFAKYFSILLDICEKQNKEFIFITAWNEWGEGAYLEPDSINKYRYLQALKELTKNR